MPYGLHGIRELPLCHGPESFTPGSGAFTIGGSRCGGRHAEPVSPGFRLGRRRRPRSTRNLASLDFAFQSGRTRTVGVPERLAGRLAPSVPGCVRRGSPARVVRPLCSYASSLAAQFCPHLITQSSEVLGFRSSSQQCLRVFVLGIENDIVSEIGRASCRERV